MSYSDIVFKRLSNIQSLPLISAISPNAFDVPSEERLKGFKRCQDLALQAARDVSGFVQEGWTEIQAAKLLDTYLRDHGVENYFHYPFVWFGERTRFDGIKSYRDFQSSSRRILQGEAMILDVAPVLNGFACDIGYTSCLGQNGEVVSAQEYLIKLKHEIPDLFMQKSKGSDIYEEINNRICDRGYQVRHTQYPMQVLGHRMCVVPEGGSWARYLNFGWQSYWSLLSRGGFGQILNQNYEGPLTGLWAIEPHIGGKNFGAKFEEILVVTKQNAYWLSEMAL